MKDTQTRFNLYRYSSELRPLFFCGDAASILKAFPDQSIDFCMTSPPYWNKRSYENGGIGLETTFQKYMQQLLAIFAEVHRILKDTGSFWLNMGDTYFNKGLAGLPWRIALALMDENGWVLRNDVIWNKIKGFDNSKDKLRNTHEYIFHFVKQTKGFFYDLDAVRSKAREAKIKNGSVVSATGVSGIRYKRQIELSTALSQSEKVAAYEELDQVMRQIAQGEISDFRMVIRQQQRTTHSNVEVVSGRAGELARKGFYFLKYHPKGSKPSDVWDILPEDTSKRDEHYAPYPADLCKIPILATCPPNGIVLDPFCGTGTTNFVAMQLGRKSVGIDISGQYIENALRRCNLLL